MQHKGKVNKTASNKAAQYEIFLTQTHAHILSDIHKLSHMHTLLCLWTAGLLLLFPSSSSLPASCCLVIKSRNMFSILCNHLTTAAQGHSLLYCMSTARPLCRTGYINTDIKYLWWNVREARWFLISLLAFIIAFYFISHVVYSVSNFLWLFTVQTWV